MCLAGIKHLINLLLETLRHTIPCMVRLTAFPREMVRLQVRMVMQLPYYRKLTLHEIKVLEINANLMENNFQIKKINAKEEVEFHNKGN